MPLSPLRLVGLLLVVAMLAGTQTSVTAAVAVTLAALLAGLLVAGGGTHAPSLVRSETLRRHSLRTAFLPQRDPDAAGRPRPRAPTAA